MGSYAECWVGSFYLGSTKNQFDPAIMQLFRSSDKTVYSGTKKDIPSQLHRWSHYVEDDEIIDVLYYSAPISAIRDRLEIKGYTVDTCKTAFNDWIIKEINQLERWVGGKSGEAFTEAIKFLKMMDVESWLSALEAIHNQNLPRQTHKEETDKYGGTLIGFMLKSANVMEENWYGFPGLDLNIALRLALEVIPSTELFIYDFTDLILSDYYSKDDDLVKLAIDWSSSRFSSTGKTIILTEGSTDAWIISESMELLYPHLSGYFTFMDFEGARVGGGTGNLANIVKAFSGTGIVNKVIAVFDNDTAASSSLRGLRNVQIPPNIKILQLPLLDFLEDYPTMGPSGEIKMNVNRLAASIELYLGKDVLLNSEGKLSPVQWTGFIPEVGKYQGEVLFKEEIQKKFKQKINECKNDKALLYQKDWSGLHAILQSLFSAFHESDGAEILAWAKEIDPI